MTKTAVVIGASRGLGFGLASEYIKRGWNVIATERKSGASSDLKELSVKAEEKLSIEQVDINVPADIQLLKNHLKNKKIDLLYVNAGVIDDLKNIGEVSTEEFNRLMVTNALSPLRVIEALDDLVTPKGTIAVMTSRLGSIANNTTGSCEVYRASKAALNMLMRSYAARAGNERSLLAIHPGHVKTAMGGSNAPLDIETSVKGIADVIAAHEGKKGLKFVGYDNIEIEW